jgi:hypothetical protein
MLFAVTDHAAERFRQRVRGTLDAKAEVIARASRAYDAGRVDAGPRGEVLVRDTDRRDLVYVCRPEGPELIVVTLWEEGEGAAVPKRFTDALRRDDHRVGD